MNHTTLSEIINLSVAERLQLLEEIWDSIVEIPEAVRLTEEQKSELDRRLVEYQLNPNAGIPWDKVKEKIQSFK